MNDDHLRDQRLALSAVDRLRRPLLRYAARLVGPDRAEDVVQETFLRLCSADPPPQVQHLAQWLFTVCRNIGIDIRRKDGRMSAFRHSHAQSPKDPQPSPPALAQRREAVSAALAAVASLPASQQEVIRLKFQSGFTYRQIAGITGLSAGNVGFLIHAAIKAIRQRLTPHAPCEQA